MAALDRPALARIPLPLHAGGAGGRGPLLSFRIRRHGSGLARLGRSAPSPLDRSPDRRCGRRDPGGGASRFAGIERGRPAERVDRADLDRADRAQPRPGSRSGRASASRRRRRGRPGRRRRGRFAGRGSARPAPGGPPDGTAGAGQPARCLHRAGRRGDRSHLDRAERRPHPQSGRGRDPRAPVGGIAGAGPGDPSRGRAVPPPGEQDGERRHRVLRAQYGEAFFRRAGA